MADLDGLEAMARDLEASGAYRVLRAVRPLPIVPRPADCEIAAVLDCETTGTERDDEAVELAVEVFAHRGGRLLGVVARASGLREPGVPMKPGATAVSGLTDADLAGTSLDLDAFAEALAGVTLVIAHKARFDRFFATRALPGLADLPWACSVDEVDWRARGDASASMDALLAARGLFADRHRAPADVVSQLAVLTRGEPGATPLEELVARSAKRTAVVSMVGSPFAVKDALKARGYRWRDGSDGRPKAWWTTVGEEALEAEAEALAAICATRPTVDWVTAMDRHVGGPN